MSRVLSTLALAALPALAAAQAPSPAPSPSPAAAPSPVPLPSPAPELQKLAFLIGDWVHAEQYQAGPWGAAGTGGARSKTSWLLGEQHLFVSYVAKSPMGQIEGRGFLNWDPDKKGYRMYWFDNMGRATVYSGDFDAAGVLVLNGETFFQGARMKQQFTIKKQDDGKVLFTHLAAAGADAPKIVFESLASPATAR